MIKVYVTHEAFPGFGGRGRWFHHVLIWGSYTRQVYGASTACSPQITSLLQPAWTAKFGLKNSFFGYSVCNVVKHPFLGNLPWKRICG